jgi:hypothetical protein
MLQQVYRVEESEWRWPAAAIQRDHLNLDYCESVIVSADWRGWRRCYWLNSDSPWRVRCCICWARTHLDSYYRWANWGRAKNWLIRMILLFPPAFIIKLYSLRFHYPIIFDGLHTLQNIKRFGTLNCATNRSAGIIIYCYKSITYLRRMMRWFSILRSSFIIFLDIITIITKSYPRRMRSKGSRQNNLE